MQRHRTGPADVRTRALSGDVVEDGDLCEDRLELGEKLLVGGVGDGGVESGPVTEGDEETVGVALLEPLGADVGGPLVADDGVDLCGEFAEGFLDRSDLFRGGGLLKAEEDDVAVEGCAFGPEGAGCEATGEEDEFDCWTRLVRGR